MRLTGTGQDNDALRAVKGALQTRPANLRTSLVLSTLTSGQLSHSMEALGGCDTCGLDELHVKCDEDLPASIVANNWRGFPNLRQLYVRAARTAYELPSPELFPKLQELNIGLPSTNQPMVPIFSTTQPYIKRLTALTLDSPVDLEPESLRLLFSPANVGTNQRTLRVKTTLDDTLLGLILQCAPALEELSVDHVWLRFDAHMHAQTQWQRLQLRHLHLSSLARLPLCPGLQLAFSDLLSLYCDTSVSEEGFAARLKDMQFSSSDNCEVHIQTDDVDNQPAGLRMALSLLRVVQVRSTCAINLWDWSMTPEVMQELPALPRCERLECHLGWFPEPHLCAAFFGLLPDSYREVLLNVAHLRLTSDQVESICLGAHNRTHETPLRIELKFCAFGLPQAIQHKLQWGPYPNVVVFGLCCV